MAAGALFDRLDSQLQQLDEITYSLGSRGAEPDVDFAESSGLVSHLTSLVERSQQLHDDYGSWVEEQEDAGESARSLLWTAEEPEFMILQGAQAGTHSPRPHVESMEYDILRRNTGDSPRLVFRFGNAFLLILTAGLLGVALLPT